VSFEAFTLAASGFDCLRVPLGDFLAGLMNIWMLQINCCSFADCRTLYYWDAFRTDRAFI